MPARTSPPVPTPSARPVWPFRAPSTTSHTRTVLSWPAEAREAPSAEKATEKTQLVCPTSVALTRRDATSHSLTVRS